MLITYLTHISKILSLQHVVSFLTWYNLPCLCVCVCVYFAFSTSQLRSQKSKLLSPVQLFVTPWTIQSMEFSRPEYWSG